MGADTAGPAPSGAQRARGAALAFALLAACLGTPLAYAPETLVYPHVTAKAAALFALVPAAAAAFAWVVCRGTAPALRRPGPVTWAAAAFVASAALSTLAGVDPALGFWDGGARRIGVFALAAFAAWAVLALACARDDARWRVLVRTSLVAGGVVAAGAVLQGLRIAELPSDGRATSTLGHAAYVGSLGLHLVFLGAALAASGGPRADVALGRVAALLGVGAIAASVTRASGVGLAAGAVVFAVWRFAPRTRRGRWVALLVVVAAATAAIVALGAFPVADSVPLLRRLAETTRTDPTVSTRLLAWDAALDAARDRPVLGWGFNAFPCALDAHFPPRLLVHGAAETWFDDAHGVLFNVIAEQGLAGVAAYVAIYVAAFLALARAQAASRISRTCAAALAAWLAARFAHLAFSFEDLSSWMGMTLVLAWIEHLAARPPVAAPPPARTGARVAAAVAALAAACAAFVGLGVLPAIGAARARTAIAAVARTPRAASVAIDGAVTSRDGYSSTSVALWAWTLEERLPELRRAGLGAEADEAARTAFALLGGALSEHPRDVQSALLRARLVELFPALAADTAAVDAVRRDLAAAREFAPRRQQVAFALAEVELVAGRPDAAADALRRAVAADPGWAGSWARLAMVYRRSGQIDEARRIVRQARERGVEFGYHERRFVDGLGE